MWVQGGTGYPSMWPILLVLATLKACEAGEDMCYQLSWFTAPINLAESRCEEYGGHLMRVRDQDDYWDLTNITSGLPESELHVIIGGTYSDGVWRHYDGTEMAWQEKWDDLIFEGTWIVFNFPSGLWLDSAFNQLRRYICEAPKVTTVSTTGQCFEPAPVMDNADKTENATHVVYACHDGFELPDGNTTKTLDCSCTALTNMEPCIERRDTCIVNMYSHAWRPREAWPFCYEQNATLPRVLNQRQNDALQQNLAKEGISSCLLDVYTAAGNYEFTLGDNSRVNYTNYGQDPPTYNTQYKYVTIAASDGLWTSAILNQNGITPVCAVVKEQVEGGCSTGRPTFPHSAITSQNATHVTYTCETSYAFRDGTTVRTVDCGCEDIMRLYGCQLVDRGICLQPIHFLLQHAQAEQYCSTVGGHLAKIASDAEMAEIQPAIYKRNFWISAHRKEDGIWKWWDDTLVLYGNWHPGHPTGLPPGNTYQRRAVLRSDASWIEQHINYDMKSQYFVCEMEPAASCPGTIPVVPHSSATSNGTHYTYTCDNYYTFDDGSPSKIVRCNCGEIVKLAGCTKTYRDVCIVNTPLRENLTVARTYCESFGATLPKVLSEAEGDWLLDLRSPQDHIIWINAVLNMAEDTWEWRDNGERVVWENWGYSVLDFRTGDINYANAHLRLDKTFLNSQWPDTITSIYCEKEYDPTVPCSEDPPDLLHGTVSATNTTHVTYRCNDEYAFPDGEPEQSFPCGCEGLAGVLSCIHSRRNSIYFRTPYALKRPIGEAFCQNHGGRLPRVYSEEEHLRIKSLIPSGETIFLAGYRNFSSWDWQWSENEKIVWNLFKGLTTTITPDADLQYLYLDPSTDEWIRIKDGHRRLLICEKIRRPDIMCDTEEPPPVDGTTLTHNGTHVNYTCMEKYAFQDGDLFKVYPCDVASLAPLYPCQLQVARDLCWVYIESPYATRPAAAEYCRKLNGSLPKILNDQEQAQIAAKWQRNMWLQASDEAEEGVWRHDDGSLLLYNKMATGAYETTDKQFMYMPGTKVWTQHQHYHASYFCQREADPETTCTSPPPAMRHADMTYTDTHVTYTCHDDAAFDDGSTTKTYTCSCASFEVNYYCIRNDRDVCFAPTKVKRSFEAQVSACQQYNLSIAKVINQNEINTIAAFQNVNGDGKHYIGASSLPLGGTFSYQDGSLLLWSRWTNSYAPGNDQAVTVNANTFNYQRVITSKYRAACEVEGDFTCEDAPEVENADRNVTATEVIYTCKPNHTFSDETTQKNYSCLCAQTAVMENCVHKLRPVCFVKAIKESTFQRTARAICWKHNAELPRLINDGDKARYLALGIQDILLDGDNVYPDQIFRYSDGSLIRWTKHAQDAASLYFASPNILYLNGISKFQRQSINYLKRVYCEVPQDETCTQTPPVVPHATFVADSTHVTYTCETGYTFLDGTTEKVYPCDCVNAAAVDPCTGPRALCLAQSEFESSQDGAQSYCNRNGAQLAKIESDEEVDLMLDEMTTSCFLSGNDKETEYDFRWYDNTSVTYSRWRQPKTSDDERAIYLHPDRLLYLRENDNFLHFLCEKEPDATFCGATPLDIAIAHGSCEKVDDVVTCTCDTESHYNDGSMVKTYSCECAAMAPLKPCALKTRADLCLVESAVTRTHTEAHNYCTQNGGQLAIVYSQAEQDRLLAMSGGGTLWLDGTVEAGQPWTLSTGDVLVWQNFPPVPSNPSRTSLLLHRNTTMWADAFSHELHGFVCEAPIDAGCSSAAPYIDNAERVLEASTVTYHCLDGYIFPDGTREKTYNCQCYGLLTVLKCLSMTVYVSSYPTTYEDAENTCVHLGGTLVQVNDAITSALTLTVIDYWKESPAWISSGSTHVSGFEGVDCVTMNTNGQWADTVCTEQHHFACQFGDVDELPFRVKSKLACWKLNGLLWGVPDDIVSSPCPRSSVYFTPGSLQTWAEAKDTCNLLGGNLARATSSDEAWMLAAISKCYNLQEAWVGGDDQSGTLQWSTGKTIVSPAGVSLTFNTADSLQCLQVDGFTWTDADCTTPQHFICEKEIGADWPDRTYCLWKEELTQTWAEAQTTCQQHGAELAWVDNASDWTSLFEASGSSTIWLGPKEETSGVWKLQHSVESGIPISWSLWAADGQDAGQLGCMVYDGASRRIREHPCTATDVTSFFCRRAVVKPTSNRRILKNLESVLSVGCNSGYGFPDGSTKKVISSAIDCKTINSWDNPSDPYNACYPTNSFMMRHFGNYKIEDDLALTDDNYATCADLVQIWSKGPTNANFKKLWSCTTPFIVTIFMNEELQNLLKDEGEDKVMLRVEVSKDPPWEGDRYKNRQFTKCTKTTNTTYSCLCLDNVNPFSVFVSVTVRDPSVLTHVTSLEICDISMSSNI